MRFFYIIAATISAAIFLGTFNLDTLAIVSGAMAFITLLNMILDIDKKLDEIAKK